MSLASLAVSCGLPATDATTEKLEATPRFYGWSVPRNTRAIQEQYARNVRLILFAEYVHTHATSERGMKGMTLGQRVVLDLVENIEMTKHVARKLRFIDDWFSQASSVPPTSRSLGLVRPALP